MPAGLPQHPRKAKRVAVSIRAFLQRAGGVRHDIELQDLSFYGFRASSADTPAEGEYVKLDLPNVGPVRARVSWVEGDSFGGSFATLVDVRKCVAEA